MKSQMAACRLAARRLDELFRKYGRDIILGAIEQIFDETERKCRNVVARIPDGVYEAASALDEDGVLADDPVPLHAKVTVAGGHMTIDLSGCSAERKAGINSRTYAAARVAYKALTGPLDPVNEGSFRALDVIIPEGNIMMARFPAPMSGWSLIVPMVVDTIIAALANAMPDRIPGAHHGLLGGSVVFFGDDPKTGRRFVVQSIEGGGWGGRPDRGRRVRHRLGMPGRRAQRLDRRDRAQMPGAGEGPRAAAGFGRRRVSTAAGSASTCASRISSTGAGISSARGATNARPGEPRAASRPRPRIISCACRRRTSSIRSAARIARCRPIPR